MIGLVMIRLYNKFHRGERGHSRVSNCVTRILKQFEAKRIEAMEIGNLLTKIEEGSSSMFAVLATIRNSVLQGDF